MDYIDFCEITWSSSPNGVTAVTWTGEACPPVSLDKMATGQVHFFLISFWRTLNGVKPSFSDIKLDILGEKKIAAVCPELFNTAVRGWLSFLFFMCRPVQRKMLDSFFLCHKFYSWNSLAVPLFSLLCMWYLNLLWPAQSLKFLTCSSLSSWW